MIPIESQANCKTRKDLVDKKIIFRAIFCVVPATFGENLIRLREAAGIRFSKDLADLIGVAPSVVSRWETNATGLPETPTLLKLAKALSCRVEDFLKGVDQDYDSVLARLEQDAVDPDILDVSGHTTSDVPVIAEGEASPQGELFWDDEGKLKSDVEDRISRPFDVRDPRAYGVRVRGDSMLPAYKPGMTLVVSPNTPVGNGDEVYVQLLTGERLLKIARRMQGGWLLESMNPAFEPRFVAQTEIGAMHPIMWSRRKR